MNFDKMYQQYLEEASVEDLAQQDPQEMEGTTGSEDSLVVEEQTGNLQNAIQAVIQEHAPELNYREFAAIVASLIKEEFGQHLVEDFLGELSRHLKA
jgi:hypothetical protein